MSGPFNKREVTPPFKGFKDLQGLREYADVVWVNLSPTTRQKRLERVTEGIDRWKQVVDKYNASKGGMYALERRISKMASFRAYAQRYPLDIKTNAMSLDDLEEAGLEPQSGEPGDLERIIAEEARQELLNGMSPRQRDLALRLEQGFKPKEFYQEYGYKTTGGIRWHRHILRAEYNERLKKAQEDHLAEKNASVERVLDETHEEPGEP